MRYDVTSGVSQNVTVELALTEKPLNQHPTLGVLRLDYDYPCAAGDIDCPSSFGYPVVYRVVPGLTFKMCQHGQMTPEVSTEFDEAVRWLTEEANVCVITGDCGFMMWFASQARALTHVPVYISALMQIPIISGVLLTKQDKVLVVTANMLSLLPMRSLITQMAGALEDDMHLKFVGCQDVPFFGHEVENGLKVDVEKAAPGIVNRVNEALRETSSVKAILLECTEMPPYADAIRRATGLPVYDAITNCDFAMNAFLNNERFGEDAWYKKWDGVPSEYRFGRELSAEQRGKLANPAVCIAQQRSMKSVMQGMLCREQLGRARRRGAACLGQGNEFSFESDLLEPKFSFESALLGQGLGQGNTLMFG
jgi:hypothetical protein